MLHTDFEQIIKLQYPTSNRNATKMLCRNLKDNPNVAENLLKIEKERTNLIELLQSTRQELHNNTVHSLLSAVDADRQKNEMVKVVVVKEKEAR